MSGILQCLSPCCCFSRSEYVLKFPAWQLGRSLPFAGWYQVLVDACCCHLLAALSSAAVNVGVQVAPTICFVNKVSLELYSHEHWLSHPLWLLLCHQSRAE